jgi:type I restriction enzyme S subunit
VLGGLDTKIEVNAQMNLTLEAMARAIFKSWFVDFDPVRAGHPLFPRSLEASQLGLVPRGWHVAPIGEQLAAVGGSTPSTSEPRFWGGPYHFATPKDMARLRHPVLLETERTITREGLTQIGSGLLPPGTVLLSSRAPIGYLAITDVPVAVNQGFIAMICDGALPNYYVLQWARQNMEAIIGNANGTTFLEISKRNFRPIPVLVPPRPILESYVGVVAPLFQRITASIKEFRTLAALRDALLPKLLSGEIRVKQAEKIVGEAV